MPQIDFPEKHRFTPTCCLMPAVMPRANCCVKTPIPVKLWTRRVAESSYSFGMGDFRKLNVWRKAHGLALSIHRATRNLRRGEFATLRNQMVRAAMSVPTNIVEGNEKRSDRDFARFLRIALGSVTELEYHLVIASDLQAISNAEFNSLLSQRVDVRKMICGLIRRLDGSGKG